jgi:hypothetical protein
MLLGEMATYFLKINELLYKDLSEQLTLQQIEKILQTKTKWSWVGFAVLPLLLFLKITVIAWVLAIGGFFHDVELKHKHYFRTVLISEFVFLLPALLKIGWFYFFEMEYTLEEVQQFVPFSLMHLLGGEGVPDWGLYPMQIINVFEIVYWILLAFLINKYSQSEKGMRVVLMGYGPALVIWIVFIMFLTLNYSV